MFSVENLTAEQRCIIQHPLDRDLYVEAPAGHGKTSTAMLKAATVAETLADSPRQRVLMLTFSKMAVRQINYEKQQHVPKPLHSKILIQTYHSFYFDLIRHYAQYLGFKHSDFGLLTTGEREALYLQYAVLHPGLEYTPFSYAHYLADGISPPVPIEGDHPPELVALAASFLTCFHKQEHRIGFEDFGYYAYRILADSSFVRDLLAHKYPVVFLDECQNTNDLQWAILQHFIHDVRLVVFADPKQTIHGFRGAGQVVEEFKREREPTSISLTTNFRNTSSLYAFAKGIATGEFDAAPPSTVSFQRLRMYASDRWRLKFRVLKLLQRSGPPVRSIAILTKENRHVAELSDFLGRKTEKTPCIPHQVIADDFGAQDEENAVLALLQLLATCDVRHLVTVACTLTACASGDSNYPLYLSQAVDKGQCTPRAITRTEGVPGIQNARAVLAILEPMVEANPPADLSEAWQRTERVLTELATISSIRNLSHALARVNHEWSILVAQQGATTLEMYMRHVMAQRRRRNFLEQRSYLRGVFVMTLHQAQGKQFDAVIIWRCNDGIIPHGAEISTGDCRPSQYLLYVGITRARHLVDIWYEEDKHRQPSRLIQPFLTVR